MLTLSIAHAGVVSLSSRGSALFSPSLWRLRWPQTSLQKGGLIASCSASNSAAVTFIAHRERRVMVVSICVTFAYYGLPLGPTMVRLQTERHLVPLAIMLFKQAAKGYLVGMHQRGRGHEMQRHAEDIPPMLLVGAGALAGLAASTATFPLEVFISCVSAYRTTTTVSSHTNLLSPMSLHPCTMLPLLNTSTQVILLICF